jgi:hypothetical protein
VGRGAGGLSPQILEEFGEDLLTEPVVVLAEQANDRLVANSIRRSVLGKHRGAR